MNCDQVERNFKASAYLAWGNMDLSQDGTESVGRIIRPSASRSVVSRGKNNEDLRE